MELELRDYIIIFMVMIIIYLFFKKYIEKFTDPATIASSITQQVADQIDNVFKADLSKLNDLGNLLNILNTDTNNNLLKTDITVNELKPDYINCENILVNGNITIEDINNFENKTFNIYPRYMVMIWTQTIIPKGWVLCDGKTWYVNKIESVVKDDLIKRGVIDIDKYIKDNNYETIVVPNLIEKFVFGAINDNTSDKYTLHNTGGAESVILAENQIPVHYHTLPFAINITNTDTNLVKRADIIDDSAFELYTYYRGGPQYGSTSFISKPHDRWETYNIMTYNQKITNNFIIDGLAIETDYARNITSPPSTINKSHENMPPYYNLVYIIRL